MMFTDWGSEEVYPSTRTALEAAPNPFSTLLEELSPYSGILYIKVLLNSKTWGGSGGGYVTISLILFKQTYGTAPHERG